MCRRRALAPLLALVAGCASEPFASPKAQPWPEADRLFHDEPRWLGGDGAYAVDLGGGRVLWLFGDSFVAPAPGLSRRQAKMVRNTVAVTTGYEPSRATIQFHLRELGGRPAPFCPDEGEHWRWPGPGARVGSRLLLFLSVLRSVPTGLGFAHHRTEAVLIDNPDEPPLSWQTRPVAVPENPFGVAIGAGALFVDQGHLYALSPVEPGDHAMHLLRWPLAAAQEGELSRPEWYTGAAAGWIALDQIRERPLPVFRDGQTELSLHYDAVARSYVVIQVDGFGAANLAARSAQRLEGPWSPLQTVYRPLESATRGVLVYSAKAHPFLLGGGATVATYCTNHSDFAALVNDDRIYFPRFVRLTLNPRAR